MSSWKTTVAGIGAILGGLAMIFKGVASGEPVDFAAALAAIMSGVGLLSARDNDKTSEAAGAS